jgi:hypothetical protein
MTEHGTDDTLAISEGALMDDQLDVPLEDVELLAEVELTTNLIIAASTSDGPLTQADIDRLLGISEQSPFPTQQVRGEKRQHAG